ncbi:MAG: hypothetical protein ABFS45_21410 [Pseudomonadota bacterium]
MSSDRTVAFDIRVDKGDIRCGCHYNLPKSLEIYVRAIGWVGRDGETAGSSPQVCG